MKLKAKYRPPPCRVRFSARGRHTFGGLPIHHGITPNGSKVPMHRLMLLDTRDKLVPLDAEEGTMPSRIPLYYPLRYGMGGGEAQYEVLDDQTIRIVSICDQGPDDEEYPFMDAFPERRFSLQPFTYHQYRAFIMSEQGSGMEISEEDRRIVREEVDPQHLIQFGGAIFPIQGDIHWKCENKRCKWKGTNARIDTFCRVSATPTDDIQIFGEYGTDVEIYFGLCRMCGTVITVNRCT